MNNQRRKAITNLLEQIEELKSGIEAVMEEERESFENMPESLQDSERGQQSDNAANCLEYANDGFEEIVDQLNEAQE